MSDTKKRYVTVRHSTSSSRWCIEAPHPVVDMPQPFFISGCAMTYPTLRAVTSALISAGFSLMTDKQDGLRYVCKNGARLVA